MALQSFFIPKSMKIVEKYFLSAANALKSVTFEDAEGWCVRKFDVNTWDALYYRELTEENFTDSLSLVRHYNGFYFSKVSDPVPYYNGIHEHEFVNGVCRCWVVNEDHVHEYVNGVCACKDVTSDHVHRYDGEGICACKAISVTHVHSYVREMCNCGLYILEE